MAEYLQSGRFLYLDTPLGPDQLIVKRFAGREAISQLFEYQVDAVAENATNVDFDKMLAQGVGFGVLGETGQTPRYFHGICSRFAQGTRDKFFTDYSMTIVPQVWLLTQKFQSRMFQNMTVPDVLRKVLQGFSVNFELQGRYEQRVYCLQYQETDFDFISRLMEEEGIFYFFKTTRNSHTMVIADTPQSHPDIPEDPKLIYEVVTGGGREEERISVWQKQQNYHAGKWTVLDHTFELPHRKLEAEQTVIDTVAVGKVQHKLKLAGNDNLEIYENPGRYAKRFDGIDKTGSEKAADLQKNFQDNKQTAQVRMQQSEMPMIVISGASNCRYLISGYKFTLQRHPNADGAYILTSVYHVAAEASIRAEAGEQEEAHYRNTFTCIPTSIKFRPPRVTCRPVLCGAQSAVVVGPPGEEIYTDKYGRIKVQFHWDRDGKNDADSSCWLRVAYSWAGARFGMISIPRIGEEVIVDFLEGDPDRPYVVGCVYNPDQMPPQTLPKYKTVTDWRTRSSPGGGRENFNEIRSEDAKGKEQLFFHAEKNQDNRTKEESREWVGKSKHKIVGGSELIAIGKSRETKIGENEIIHIVGNDKEAIDGNVEIKVVGNHQQSTGGRYAYQAGTEVHVKAGAKIVIEAPQISLKGAGGFIDISGLGVVIQGNLVLINSGGAAGSGSGSSPDVPEPKGPDTADDGTKFDKM
jgi:type VI secretion system secreted protein VgrG